MKFRKSTLFFSSTLLFIACGEYVASEDERSEESFEATANYVDAAEKEESKSFSLSKTEPIPEKALRVPDDQPNLNVSLNQKGRLSIKSGSVTSHTMGMKMRTGNGVKRIVIDKGVYSMWQFKGTNGKDTLVFGSQGTIINKKRGGVIDFGEDRVVDKFIFKNTINVEACSKKHGFKCHPLNHLQKVVIKNFGPEDKVILQGKTYTINDLNNGVFRGVPPERLKVASTVN